MPAAARGTLGRAVTASSGDSRRPRPPTPRFRPGRPADASAIRRLVWAEKMNPLALNPARFLVADFGGGGGEGLAAIGQVVPVGEAADGAAEIRSLVVAEGLRGRGLGAALLAALVEAAPPGTASLWLTTLAGRAPFYERAGFRIVPPPGTARGGGQGGRGWLAGSFTSPDIPRGMRFEVAAGAVAAPLLGGDELVIMRRDFL